MSDVFVYHEPVKVLADVIQAFMQLKDGQVMTSNQKYEIPTDGLYVALSYVGPSKVLSSWSELVDDGQGGTAERLGVTMLHMIQIDIMSYDNSARIRKEEIAMALRSIYSQQSQELYSMQIAQQPSGFSDTSFLEETKMMTRYTTTVKTSSVNRVQRTTNEYYSDFSKAVPPQLVVNE